MELGHGGLFNEYINPEATRSSWNIRVPVIDPFTGRVLTEKEEHIVEEMIERRVTDKEDLNESEKFIE